MPVSHDHPLQNNPAFREICRLREDLLQLDSQDLAKNLPTAERELFSAVNKLGLAIFQEVLAHLDVDVHGVVVKGERYVKRKGKTPGTYFSLFGKTKVLRTTYRKRGCRGSESIVPLELRAGFVGGSWTLEAAKAASAFMAIAPSRQARELLASVSFLTPSATHLDRLPKIFNEKWESEREAFEAVLREKRTVPEPGSVALILLSKDGIMTPMKDAPRVTDPDKEDTGPKGHQECGCATVSFFDAEGSRLQTFSCARMPEPGKVVVGEWLEHEARWAMKAFPRAHLMAVADGAKDNWTYFERLEERLGCSMDKVLDFFHAMEHIAKAFRRYRGRDQSRARKEIGFYRKILRDEPGGFRRVIQALEYRAKRSKGSMREDIEKELGYMRNNAERMRYHRFRKKNRPIGSGIQEAACKALVAERLKLSGMSWRHKGGQGVLTLRAIMRAGQLSEAWDLLRPSLIRPFSVDQDTKRQRYAGAR